MARRGKTSYIVKFLLLFPVLWIIFLVLFLIFETSNQENERKVDIRDFDPVVFFKPLVAPVLLDEHRVEIELHNELATSKSQGILGADIEQSVLDTKQKPRVNTDTLTITPTGNRHKQNKHEIIHNDARKQDAENDVHIKRAMNASYISLEKEKKDRQPGESTPKKTHDEYFV